MPNKFNKENPGTPRNHATATHRKTKPDPWRHADAHTHTNAPANASDAAARRYDPDTKRGSGPYHRDRRIEKHTFPSRQNLAQTLATREEAAFRSSTEFYNKARRKGFSLFQLRLVNAILSEVLEKRRSLDKAYALWFSKVKLQSVEQGFLIRQINAMFARLSFYAHVSGLKRPSDFRHHVSRLCAAYCVEQGWPMPNLDENVNFERRLINRRLQEARSNPLMNEGCPIWLNELGEEELGEKWPALRALLAAPAGRFIRTNTLKCTRNELASELTDSGIVTRPLKGSSIALEVTSSAALFRTEAFRNGKFEQQDAGSQQIAPFLDPQPGERIIDACAGSGGKTLQLAALMHGRGIIIAMDTEGWKLDELKRRARRAGAFNIEPRLIDSTKAVKRLADSADRVLIDAPCSGSGVLRRTPDSKWRDARENIRKLQSLQQELLVRYTKMCKKGGIIVYSTCSIFPGENEKQVHSFIAGSSGAFRLLQERQLLPSAEGDGFYMAKIERLA